MESGACPSDEPTSADPAAESGPPYEYSERYQVPGLAWAFAGVTTVSLPAPADDPRGAAAAGSRAQDYAPKIAPPSEEAARAIRTFRVPQGLKIELFAAEPLLANPVAFCLDEKGVVYVA